MVKKCYWIVLENALDCCWGRTEMNGVKIVVDYWVRLYVHRKFRKPCGLMNSMERSLEAAGWSELENFPECPGDAVVRSCVDNSFLVVRSLVVHLTLGIVQSFRQTPGIWYSQEQGLDYGLNRVDWMLVNTDHYEWSEGSASYQDWGLPVTFYCAASCEVRYWGTQSFYCSDNPAADPAGLEIVVLAFVHETAVLPFGSVAYYSVATLEVPGMVLICS